MKNGIKISNLNTEIKMHPSTKKIAYVLTTADYV